MKRNEPALPLMTHATHPRLMRLLHRGWLLTICYLPETKLFRADMLSETAAGGSPLEAVDRLEHESNLP